MHCSSIRMEFNSNHTDTKLPFVADGPIEIITIFGLACGRWFYLSSLSGTEL